MSNNNNKSRYYDTDENQMDGYPDYDDVYHNPSAKYGVGSVKNPYRFDQDKDRKKKRDKSRKNQRRNKQSRFDLF